MKTNGGKLKKKRQDEAGKKISGIEERIRNRDVEVNKEGSCRHHAHTHTHTGRQRERGNL